MKNYIVMMVLLSGVSAWGASQNTNSSLSHENCQKIVKAETTPLPQQTNTPQYHEALQVNEQLAALKAKCHELHQDL